MVRKNGEWMMSVATIKVLAATCSLIGSGLLAWRVTGILRALALVVHAHEANIVQLMNGGRELVHFANSTAHVENAQRYWVLILGFLFILASASLQLLSLLI